jgi:hypothetical protein
MNFSISEEVIRGVKSSRGISNGCVEYRSTPALQGHLNIRIDKISIDKNLILSIYTNSRPTQFHRI